LTTLAAREMAPMAKFRKVSPDIPFFVGHFICKNTHMLLGFVSQDKLLFSKGHRRFLSSSHAPLILQRYKCALCKSNK
jgi:hypothetical protein